MQMYARVCVCIVKIERNKEMDSFYRRKEGRKEVALSFRALKENRISRDVSLDQIHRNVFQDRADNFSFPCGPKQDNQLLPLTGNIISKQDVNFVRDWLFDTDIRYIVSRSFESLVKSSPLSKLFRIIQIKIFTKNEFFFIYIYIKGDLLLWVYILGNL